MWPLILAGAGVGAMRSMQQEQQAKQDRKREAEIARWSPWTGMQAQRPGNPDYMGNLMQGGMTGAMMGQAMGGGSAGAGAGAGGAGAAGSSSWAQMSSADPNGMAAAKAKYPWLNDEDLASISRQ